MEDRNHAKIATRGKKIMRIKYIFLAGLLLSGCTKISDLTGTKSSTEQSSPVIEKKTDTKSYVLVCDNDSSEEVTFEAKGDQINKMTQTFDMSFEDLGISVDLDSNAIKDKINASLDEKYNALDGVQITSEIQDQKVHVTIEIDFSQADLNALVEKGLLDQGEIESSYVSLAKTKKDYKASGYACKTQ